MSTAQVPSKGLSGGRGIWSESPGRLLGYRGGTGGSATRRDLRFFRKRRQRRKDERCSLFPLSGEGGLIRGSALGRGGRPTPSVGPGTSGELSISGRTGSAASSAGDGQSARSPVPAGAASPCSSRKRHPGEIGRRVLPGDRNLFGNGCFEGEASCSGKGGSSVVILRCGRSSSISVAGDIGRKQGAYALLRRFGKRERCLVAGDRRRWCQLFPEGVAAPLPSAPFRRRRDVRRKREDEKNAMVAFPVRGRKLFRGGAGVSAAEEKRRVDGSGGAGSPDVPCAYHLSSLTMLLPRLIVARGISHSSRSVFIHAPYSLEKQEWRRRRKYGIIQVDIYHSDARKEQKTWNCTNSKSTAA